MFIQARNFTKTGGRSVRLLVMHTMEAPEKPGTALAVAHWFAGPDAPQASAHYCVDDKDVVQCVAEMDVAWAAPGANKDGIHIEHAGYAKQTTQEWFDAYSTAVLKRSAQLVADLCHRWVIPIRWLSVDEVSDGETQGICGHYDVTQAFHKSTHTDPGTNFPKDHFIELIQQASAEAFPLT